MKAQDADLSETNRRVSYFLATPSEWIRSRVAVERRSGAVRLLQPVDREAPGSSVYSFTVSTIRNTSKGLSR